MNQTGISIRIKAFLETGKTLDEQHAALSMMKRAHETGDYSEVLKHAVIDEVLAEPKTRRVSKPAAAPVEDPNEPGLPLDSGDVIPASDDDFTPPAFLRS